MNIFSQAVQAGKVGELEIQPSYIEVSKYKYGSIAAINSNDNLSEIQGVRARYRWEAPFS